MTTTKAHCPETRLRNAFAKFMQEHGRDKAIAVIQKTLNDTTYGNRKAKAG